MQEVKIMTVRDAGPEITMKQPADVAKLWATEVCKSAWYQEKKEMFVVFLLDARNHIKTYNLVTIGLIDASLAHPREVFRLAILGGASAIVIAHNHPSGDTTPSAEDIRMTRQLAEAGKIVDVKLMDHVIIGKTETDFCSMRERGIICFA